MLTVHKFQLKVEEHQMVEMNHGAQILSIQAQGNHVCAWALVDTERPMSKYELWCYGTGHEIPVERYGVPKKHIATVQQGVLVWHFFANDFSERSTD